MLTKYFQKLIARVQPWFSDLQADTIRSRTHPTDAYAHRLIAHRMGRGA